MALIPKMMTAFFNRSQPTVYLFVAITSSSLHGHRIDPTFRRTGGLHWNPSIRYWFFSWPRNVCFL